MKMKTMLFQNEKFLIFLIIVLTASVYLPTLRNGFIWDDDDYIYENDLLRSPDGLKHIWGSFSTPQYYPLVFSSFYFEYKIWGLNPAGYHLTNVLLHTANGILLFFLLKRLGISLKLSWLIALLFAVHPVQVESVAWATERKNVLSGFFYFSSFITFLRYEDTQKRRHYLFSLLFFVLALLSKTVSATLAAALILAAFLRGRLRPRLVREMVPFFFLGLGMGLLTGFLEKHRVGAYGAEWDLSILQRIIIASRALWFYFQKLILPYRLSFIYPRWEINAASPTAYLPLLATAAAAFIIGKFRKRLGRVTIFGMLYFAVTLFPALGFINFYPMRYSFVADHFQYLACWGMMLVLATALNSLIGRLRPRRQRLITASLIATLFVGICAYLSFEECKKYKNQEMLWKHTISVNPTGWMAYNNLGKFLFSQGRYEEAVHYYQKALEIKPDHFKAYHNIGLVHLKSGKSGLAVQSYQNALRLKPAYPKAYNGLGIAYWNLGQFQKAIQHFQEAIKLKPDFAEAHYNLSVLYRSRHNYDLARHHLEISEKLGFAVPTELKQTLETEP